MVAGLCLAGGAALCCAPSVVQEQLRSVVRDGLRPGQTALATTQEYARRSILSDATVEQNELEQQFRDEVRTWKAEARRNAALAARAANVNEKKRLEASIGISGEPLFSTSLLSARILSRAECEEAGRILAVVDAGRSSDATAAQWVVDGELIAVDQGEEELVTPDCPVITGRSVFGRIVTAGRWTSSVQHVSDKEFRTHARLMRSSPNGPVQGAEGMLVGVGNSRCRLELVANTEPVEVGDEVWTASTIPGLDETFYLGHVTRAELIPTEAHWSVDVEPDVRADAVERVQIVRVGLNRARIGGSDDGRDEVLKASHEEVVR
jgi:rod shape-determining protein MreC